MSPGRTSSLAAVLLLLAMVAADDDDVVAVGNEIPRSIRSGEELLSAVVDDCFLGEGGWSSSPMTCLRMKVLSYLDADRGRGSEDLRGADARELDEMIADRVGRYLRGHEFKVQLPEFLFQGAVLTFRPSRGLADFRVEFPEDDPGEDRALTAARGMLKKKLLLPLLLLLKLKMKLLTPLLLVITKIKAFKALVLSKVAILLVVGFMLSQLLKKAGMNMPMAMPMPMNMPMMPADQYGAPSPAPAMPYGAPSTVSTQPSLTYESSWDGGSSSSSGGPYSRVWDPQQSAYSAYSQTQASGQQTQRRRRR